MAIQSVLWITDPWHTLAHAQDTTLRFAEEGLKLKVPQYWCDVHSIRLHQGKPVLTAKKILSMQSDPSFEARSAQAITFGAEQLHAPSDFQMLQYRVDPPVNLGYLHPLQILALDSKARERITNPLNVLLESNEKMIASRIPDLLPPSCVSSQWDALEAFGRQHKHVVLKPLYEAQSKGVELLDFSAASRLSSIKTQLRLLTHGFTEPVLLQKYLKGIAQGEVRLWYCDGQLLPTVRKLPLHGDFRVNIDRGSRLAPTPLLPTEKKAAQWIGKFLKKEGIRLAAVDLIDGWVTDFNFTSPGLICQMETTLGMNLAGKIVKRLLQHTKN